MTMKVIKRIFACLLILAIIFNSTSTVYAYERAGHDELMLDVMFKNFKEIDNDKTVQKEISALESACYLTIDQFNESGQKDLDFLNTYGVKGLPKSINDIKISAGPNTHRNHTHRGWDYGYVGEAAVKWPKRQELLKKTVDTVFDFGGNNAQRDAFCELLYYVHILGDHIDDTSYKINNGLKIGVGGRTDQYDITHKLLDCIEIVFSEQKHTHKYRSLTSAIERYNSRFSKIVRSEGGIDTEEKFQQYNEYTKDFFKMLTMYIPEMLKDEPFFAEVFYSN